MPTVYQLALFHRNRLRSVRPATNFISLDSRTGELVFDESAVAQLESLNKRKFDSLPRPSKANPSHLNLPRSPAANLCRSQTMPSHKCLHLSSDHLLSGTRTAVNSPSADLKFSDFDKDDFETCNCCVGSQVHLDDKRMVELLVRQSRQSLLHPVLKVRLQRKASKIKKYWQKSILFHPFIFSKLKVCNSHSRCGTVDVAKSAKNGCATEGRETAESFYLVSDDYSLKTINPDSASEEKQMGLSSMEGLGHSDALTAMMARDPWEERTERGRE